MTILFLLRGAAAVVFACLISTQCLSRSELPDFNGSQHPNNDFATAPEIDVLRLDSNGNAQGIYRTEELGAVLPGRFDSQDIYRFTIPPGNSYRLGFFLREQPQFTVAIEVFRDPNSDPIGGGIGNPNERFILDLSPGLYYIRIFTTALDDIKRVYDLTVSPELLRLPDQAGPDCTTSVNLGEIVGNRRVTGSLDAANSIDAYQFRVPTGFFGGASTFSTLRDYDVYIVPRNSGERFKVAERNGHSYPSLPARLFDPGFYCVLIQREQLSGPINYDVDIISLRSGLPMGLTPQMSQFITTIDLGVLRSNGHYGDTRYVEEHPPMQLKPSRQYVLREWIGIADPSQWLRFSLPEPSFLKLGLYKLTDNVGIEVLSASGVTVAVGQSSGSLLDGFVLDVKLEADLPSGDYFVRLVYLGQRGPGTSYALEAFRTALP